MTSPFLRSVFTMMTGTVIAQAIPLLVSPLLTRLYAPEDYGLFVLFLAVAGVISVVSTLRYELAIVIAASPTEAAQVARLCLVLLSATSAVVALASLLFAEPVAALAGHPGQTAWVYWLAPMVALLGCFQIGSYLTTRARDFGRLATATVIQQTLFAAVALGVGFALRWPSGLVLARVAGLAGAAGTLARPGSLRTEQGRQPPGLASVACRYRQFALYNCPYSLVGTAGRELFVLAMMAASQAGAAGFFGLARSVVYAPVTLLSAALSQVFYREAAATLYTPAFEEIVLRLTRSIVRIATPAFAALPVLAPATFAFVFGDRWREAGQYAALLAPVGFLFLFSSWPERVFEVAGRQRVSFLIQLAFDAAAAALLVALVRAGLEPLLVLAAVVTVWCLFHVSYVLAAARVARLALARFRPLLAEAIVLGFAGAALAWLAITLLMDIRVVLAACGTGLLAYYWWLIPYVKRDFADAGAA